MAMALEEYKNDEDLKEKILKQVQFLSDFKGSHNLRVNVIVAEPLVENGTRLTDLDGGAAAISNAEVFGLTGMEPDTQVSVSAVMKA